MNIKYKKIIIGVISCFIGLVGCNNSINSETTDYLLCNKTSNGQMAEVENGYFHAYEGFLYYADKDNLEQWVPVCNKPDCLHTDYTCNAELPTYNVICQNDEKLYGLVTGRAYGQMIDVPYIYEILVDGSGSKKVYEISLKDSENPDGYTKALFQDEFLLHYSYLDEKGLHQNKILSLKEDDKGEIIISNIYEEAKTLLMISGNLYWNIRGDNLIATTLYAEEGNDWFKNLCKNDGEKIIPLNLPDDINKIGGYLKDNIFTYYQQQEGFYQYNLETQEKTRLFEKQLEDGQGYILTENCMVECNRYKGYLPKDAYLKVYNGKEWIEIELLEELLINATDSFIPLCVASDRIFFRRTVLLEDKTTIAYLYYVMLYEENPKMIPAGKIGEEEQELPTEDSTEYIDDNVFSNFEEMIVWDTEDYLFKITDVYLDYSNRCCIDFYLENKSADTTYDVFGNHSSVNGIQCDTFWGVVSSKNEIIKDTICFNNQITNPSKLLEFYNSYEYTDIEFVFSIFANGRPIEEKYVHIYPQGKEHVVTFIREPQSTDVILVDNENVSIIITGFEKQFIDDDTINVIIQNKTNQLMTVKVEDASANGIQIQSDPRYGVYYTFVNPNAIAMYPMTLFDGITLEGPYQSDPSSLFFSENNIISIEEIEMKLQVSLYSSVKEGNVTEELLNKTVILTP